MAKWNIYLCVCHFFKKEFYGYENKDRQKQINYTGKAIPVIEIVLRIRHIEIINTNT